MTCEQEFESITPKDWAQIKQWNQRFPEQYHECVHHIFEHQADLQPEAPAVCAWDGNLTYDELDKLSTRLGYHLMSLGISRGDYVPFCFEKSLWTIVATAAILKAGGAYVPLDPSHPRDRLLGIIGDVEAKVVLASFLHTDLVSGSKVKAITISKEAVENLIREEIPDPLYGDVKPTDPAVVFFTSGSTGRPKGVVLQHSAIATNARSHGEALQITRISRVLQFAAHGWDVATMDMWTTLMRGGCVCVPSEQERRSDIAGAMERMQVNWALLTPSFVDLIHPADVRGLKILVLAGEPMKQELIPRWSENVRFFNAYGPAETGACTAIEYSKEGRAESIGKQLTANLCWIVDVNDHDRLLPIGSVGELLVEGPNLALEYLGDEVKTKAKFIENPKFLRSSRSRRPRRLYKTGDLARFCSNGSIDFKGRQDNQIKIRGQRAELSEIENIIETHQAVSKAIVCYPKNGPLRDQLVCIVQTSASPTSPGIDSPIRLMTEGDQGSSTLALQSQLFVYLSTKLPPHMLPDIIMVVQQLPLTLSAKIDRKKVENWLLSMSDEEADHARGRSSGELMLKNPLLPGETTARRVSAKLAEIVGIKDLRLGALILAQDVILMDLGVDSIQYIKLLTFVKQTWGIAIPLATLVGSKTTVRAIAQHIDAAGKSFGNEAQGISGANLLAEVATYLERLKLSAQASSLTELISDAHDPSTVLLTGSTGFLGTHILRHLLTEPTIKRVVTHVRAENESSGFERIVSVARKSGWWQNKYTERVEVWVGDLAAEPCLGLSMEQWNRIRGLGEHPINAIIHNGARVHWLHSYNSLKPTNVKSTELLLLASIESTSVARFTYVSGGQQLRLQERNDQERAEEASTFNGYAQTKLVSEILVREVGRLDGKARGRPNRFQTVKPGYIIGTIEKGITNPDDFLWRLAVGVIEAKGYNKADEKDFLFISDVDRVAVVICNSLLATNRQGSDEHQTNIFDGVTMEEFWHVFRRFYSKLEPMNEDEWLRSLRDVASRTKEHHPLYPVLHIMEKKQTRIASPNHPTNLVPVERRSQIQAAIWSNIKYLLETGFFPRTSPNYIGPEFPSFA